MHEGSKRAIVAAFAANLGIALSKLVAFAFTGAASMLAEAIHSVADTGNQGLLMLGSRRARRPADEAHPFGYGTARYFWAFVVALVLFTLGGVFAIYEGIDKLRHPHQLDSPAWAIGVLAIAFALEAFSFRTVIREIRPQLGERTLAGFVRNAKSPELPVVLLEDTGALVGLLFALAGVTLAELTGNPRWDAAGSLAIGVLLVAVAIVLAIEMASLLVGEAADPSDEHAIRAAIARGTGVRSTIHLRTLHIGPDDIMVAAKLEFDDALSVAELAAAIDAVEVEIRAAVSTVGMIFIEPDLRRPS